METIILAGGLGTRLRELNSNLPKSMMPIGNVPFLELLLDQLNKMEISRVILAVGYKKNIIKEYFKTQYKNIELVYSEETEPLGTGGAIKKAVELTNEEYVFVFNGDTFFDIDLREMYKYHLSKKCDITIATKEMEEFDRYGSLMINVDNEILGFQEKQYKKKGIINGGIYLFNPQIMNQMDKKIFSFEKDFLENENIILKKYSYLNNNYFIDIGIPDDYFRFKKLIESKGIKKEKNLGCINYYSKL